MDGNNNSPAFHKFNLGDIECTILYDSQTVLPIEKVFPSIEPSKRKGSASFINMGFNYLFVKTKTCSVLIDTGRGNGELLNSLQKADIFLSSIDYVLLTHCDADHVSGFQQYALADRRLKAFQNTEIIMPRRMWEMWTNKTSVKKLIKEFENTPFVKNLPEEKRKASIQRRRLWAEEYMPKLKNHITLLEEGTFFLNTFKFIYAPGHRSDHYAIMILSSNDYLLHVGDAFRHSLQVKHPELYSIFDSNPKQLTKTIKALVSIAKENNTKIFGTHFTYPGLFSISKNNELIKM